MPRFDYLRLLGRVMRGERARRRSRTPPSCTTTTTSTARSGAPPWRRPPSRPRWAKEIRAPARPARARPARSSWRLAGRARQPDHRTGGAPGSDLTAGAADVAERREPSRATRMEWSTRCRSILHCANPLMIKLRCQDRTSWHGAASSALPALAGDAEGRKSNNCMMRVPGHEAPTQQIQHHPGLVDDCLAGTGLVMDG